MNLNSSIFDKIRSRPRRAAQARPKAQSAPVSGPRCDHPGCEARGEFRAPKGRTHEGQYFQFCMEHVREYNASYNYFAGMTDDAVQKYQKDALVGHRPTWSMGVKGGQKSQAGAEPGTDFVFEDPLGVFKAGGFAGRHEPEQRKPGVGPVAKKAYDALGLDETVDAATVKARYKELVKQNHPDANGGDRSYEDRLREIITAYNTLKAAGRG
ncbi:molecular chaperone DnaJ [Alsobacter metallidurans]|uniref:Molecular chaperone DnaJ n=1 Tax=Alsobacter metallidurans TaxID=340221 RepID=A0A917IBH2_9HYPH|nr:J domain-containing protein [Alsobacter metallidurans]GGH31320.1 molecular chaperone DnaJ [Alsobacter metallidurans]